VMHVHRFPHGSIVASVARVTAFRHFAWIVRFQDRLADCRSFEERVAVANQFLLQRTHATPARDGVTAAAHQMLSGAGAERISLMAGQAALSERQFRRIFAKKIGLGPKLFARIARFEGALDWMGRSPHGSWAEIAQRFGYYDQMHLVHEFAQFTGQTPTRTLQYFEAAPIMIDGSFDPATGRVAQESPSISVSQKPIFGVGSRNLAVSSPWQRPTDMRPGRTSLQTRKGIGPIAFAGHHGHRLAAMHTMQSRQKRSRAECQHQQSQQQCLLPPRQPGNHPPFGLGAFRLLKTVMPKIVTRPISVGSPAGGLKASASYYSPVLQLLYPRSVTGQLSMRDGIGDIVS
jgi:AraC-like DNA-binding protein